MILQDIQDRLKEIDTNTFYGTVDSSMKDTAWDYIVFERKTLKVDTSKKSYTDVFSVHIIREEYIPEGLEEQVINKMCEIPGVRVSGDGGTYEYTLKPNTNVVLEIFSIDFVKPRKV